MMTGTIAAVTARLCLALCLTLSGTIPVYAGIPAPPSLSAERAVLDLLQRIQTVDPGGGDGTGTGDGNGDGNGGREGRSSPSSSEGREHSDSRLSRLETDRIIRDLRSVRLECTDYDQVYRIDCLRQGIDMVVASMPNDGDYREPRAILRRASRQLAGIVSAYQDRDAPKLVAPRNANPRFNKRRSYRAVKRTQLPKAMMQANAVISEAATQLLRSAENSERRYAHYQKISVAVDSTKVLLRSG